MNEQPDIFQYIKNYDPIRAWHFILIHHSQTKDKVTQDWEGIRKYHKEVKGWAEIGYQFGIEFENGRYVYKIGRPLHEIGAHCKGLNDDAIGICVVGNFDLVPPCHQQYFLTASLCRALQDKYGIKTENIQPHWLYNEHKTCPGEKFSMHRLREYIKGVTGVGSIG